MPSFILPSLPLVTSPMAQSLAPRLSSPTSRQQHRLAKLRQHVQYLQKNSLHFLRALFSFIVSTTFDLVGSCSFSSPAPTLYSFLSALVILLVAIALQLEANKLVRKLGKRWYGGRGVMNWTEEALWETAEARKVVEDALGTLRRGSPTLFAAGSQKKYTPTASILNLEVTQTLVLLSALLYERTDSSVSRASKNRNVESCRTLLGESEEAILDGATNLGLTYETLSDLGHVGGSFAGVYYPSSTLDSTTSKSEKPFLVLCFRGPGLESPATLFEHLTPRKIASGAGKVQEATFRSLFSTTQDEDGYVEIMDNLRDLASDLRRKSEWDEPVPLWITGHFLGASLAALFFTRLRCAPQDLGEDLRLADCVTFGAPPYVDDVFLSAHLPSTTSTSPPLPPLFSLHLASSLPLSFNSSLHTLSTVSLTLTNQRAPYYFSTSPTNVESRGSLPPRIERQSTSMELVNGGGSEEGEEKKTWMEKVEKRLRDLMEMVGEESGIATKTFWKGLKVVVGMTPRSEPLE